MLICIARIISENGYDHILLYLYQIKDTKMKRIYVIVMLAMSMLAQAESREQLCKIAAGRYGQFNYWKEGSTVLESLKNYISEVTDEKSGKFIPKKDRIAVFDMDGTLISETTPYYSGWLLWMDFVKQYPDKVSKENRQFAEDIHDDLYAHKHIRDPRVNNQGRYQYECFTGMTANEFHAYARNWMDTTPAGGMNNMKIGESFYLPMLEVISYLTSNGFTIYIVSGADRGLVRATIDGVIDIPMSHCIGSDIEMRAALQGESRDYIHTIKAGERVERTGNGLTVNVAFTKIKNIIEEIGQKPVLAFGNSTGDYAMFQYVTDDNRYQSAAYCIMCDDTERDYGNAEIAENMKGYCEDNGWHTISTREDWKTIYGYEVTKK